MQDQSTLEARFWAQVERTDGCWYWRGRTIPDGYGHFRVGGETKRYAHRMAYMWTKGPIATGMEIDHLCRVRNCVNPDHLEAVTRRENIRRSENWMARQMRGEWFPPEDRASSQ